MPFSIDDRTPAERRMAARLAAFSKWANTDAREGTAPARAKSPSSWAYFEVQVDPGGALSPDERRRRAEAARKAYFLRLALKSAKARRERGGSGDGRAV